MHFAPLKPPGSTEIFTWTLPKCVCFLMKVVTITEKVFGVIMAVLFLPLLMFVLFYFLYVRTGALRNGCSFEDDLSLGAEGQ